MYTSPNLGLTVWDLPTDDFDHTQLSQNWIAVDNHDHSSGRGVQIGTNGIQNAAITSALLALGAVGNPQLAAGAVGTTNIQNGAVGTTQLANAAVTSAILANAAVGAAQLDPTIVPLGSVMLWWRPPGSAATPGGFWEAMDGRAWNSITNAWGLTSGNIPDTRGIFAKGSDLLGINGPAMAATGGSASLNLAHSHNVAGHTHTVPAHEHTITADGSHVHTWQGGLQAWARTNCFPKGTTIEGLQGQTHFNGYYSMYISGLAGSQTWVPEQDQQGIPGVQHPIVDGQLSMDAGGSHSHGGATQPSAVLTSGSSTSTTDSQLGAETIDPPWVSLLYIMRCR